MATGKYYWIREDKSCDLNRISQGIIDSTGTETYAKEPKLAQFLWKLKSMPVRC